MVYNNNIPQPNDKLSASQPQILENFAQLETKFTDDHNSLAVDGHHKFVHIPVPLGADPVMGALEGQFYTKDSGGVAQAYFRNNTTTYPLTPAAEPKTLIHAWAYFSAIVPAGPVTIYSSYGISSITYSAAPNPVLTINLTTPFSGANNYIYLKSFTYTGVVTRAAGSISGVAGPTTGQILFVGS